ncbi:MAG TPA: DNA mismatch endonuclease Vsr [Clostridiaceae bacterium]|nr:DNA mismatch endonuclease Vsr [Clostridiaceae bacterium]
MDIHSKDIRSYNMSMIKSRNTKPEGIVRTFLFSNGFRYRKNDKKLPGCPDIVLPKYKTVVFINGCFWHVHENCKYFAWPSSNAEFWKEKLRKNKQRDEENVKKLANMGWKVIIVWECELKKPVRNERLEKLLNEINPDYI